MHRYCVKSLSLWSFVTAAGGDQRSRLEKRGLLWVPLCSPREAPRSSSGQWWRWVHSRRVGGGQGLSLLFLQSPLPTQVSPSALSSPPPACISVLSACPCQALWRPRRIVPAPGGLMGGVWVRLSALEPGNNGLHVFCTHYPPGPVLRDSPASISPKGTLAGTLSSPFYRRREHTLSA